MVNNPDQFNQNFLGIIDNSTCCVEDGIIDGLLDSGGSAAYLQYYLTSKQLSPQSDSNQSGTFIDTIVAVKKLISQK